MSNHSPVLVGVAQVLQREDDLAQVREPLALMIDAVERAAEDAGSRELLARASSVRVVRGMWRYGDPGRAVAQAIGCPSTESGITQYGGNFVQSLLNRSCLEIESGARDIVILTGAECGRSQARSQRAGRDLAWSEAPGKPDFELGDELVMTHDAERARGILQPIQMYPIFDIALRHELGESPSAHIERVSKLWAGFSEVASQNPNAWIRRKYSAEEIRTPGQNNRAVSYPYPMLMNSNSRVDMGAALILCSEETAKRLGIARDKWVYPHAGSDAHDHYYVSERDELCASPAIRIAGARALELAEVEVGDLGYVDVYSCFPSAVQVAARELGLDPARPLTVTGGLTFGGGPMNNYVMHGIARMAEVLRADPGAKGLCTANGGFLTKHAFGIYSTEPSGRAFRHEDVQAQVDVLPRRNVVVDHAGEVEIEGYVVMYEGESPGVAHAACRLPDGSRTWGNVADRDTALAMVGEEFCGRAGRLDGSGGLTVGT